MKLKIGIFIASLLVLLYIVFTRFDMQIIGSVTGSVNWMYFYVAVGFSILAFIFMSIRFVSVLRTKFSLLQTIPISFVSLFVSVLTPLGIGDISKVFYVEKLNKTPKGESMMAFVMEKVIGLLILLFVGVFTLVIISSSTPPAFILFVIIFALLIIHMFRRTRLNDIVLSLSYSILPHRIAKKLEMAEKDFYKNISSITKKTLSVFLFLSLLIFLFGLISIYFTVLAVTSEASFVVALAIYSLPTLFGIVSTVPGGFGVREISMIAILEVFLASQSEVLVITALATVVGVIIPSIIGFIFNLNFLRKA